MAEGENEFEYFMYGPVLVPIAALGIIGNILSIIVYSRPSMRKFAINIILIGLFICILIQPCPFDLGLRKFALDPVVVTFFKKCQKNYKCWLIQSL